MDSSIVVMLLNLLLLALSGFAAPQQQVLHDHGSRLRAIMPGDSPVGSMECQVKLAKGRMIQGESSPKEILHCFLDEPDELGYNLYEIKGLEDYEFLRIKNDVSSGQHHRYYFSNVTRLSAAPIVAGLFYGEASSATSQSIDVSKSGSIGKIQAIKKERRPQKNGKDHRSLNKLEGVHTVLVVRVVALDDATTCSPNDCRVHTFGGYDDEGVLNDMNMKSQIDNCSYGKFKFVEPADNSIYPDVVGGVVTIMLNKNVIGVHHGTVLDWLITETPQKAGPLEAYDHVMFFMPPGVDFDGGVAAVGHMPGSYTWYHDQVSLSTDFQLHELGHNIGLDHSGEDGDSYGDGSCYMGGGVGPKNCYNAAKNYYLGWYSEFYREFNPLQEISKLYYLVGLSDYDEALASSEPSRYTVVLRIETFESESLYLAYNRAEKMNIGVGEFQDKVTVVRANGQYQSWVEAGLGPGQKYSTSIVNGSGLSLEIVVCDCVAGSPDYAIVSVHQFGESPLCIPRSPIASWQRFNGALEDSLVAHYTFDSNQYYLDTSGNRNHAFEFGNPTFISDGAVGQALSFDGVDDYLELPDFPELDFDTSDFTLTFWYRVADDQSGRPVIIGNKNWKSPSNPGWAVSSNYGPGSNGDDLSINLSDGITKIDGDTAIDVDFDTWHFIAVRVKRGDKMSLLRTNQGSYVLQEDVISSIGSLRTNFKIRIGTSHDGCGAVFSKMDIDDLAIWSRAVSSEEVESIWMAARKRGFNVVQAHDSPNVKYLQRPPVMAKYEFENNLIDSTSNNPDGILTGGGLTFISTTVGYHINLNNVDFQQKSYVTLPNSDLFDFGVDTSFTISFWQRTSTDFSSAETSIISNKDWESSWNPGWTIGVGNDGRLEWNAGDGADWCDYYGPAGMMTDGQWHHVAVSMLRGTDGQITLFFDGKILDQNTCILNSLSSGYPINVGTDGRGGVNWPGFYTGDIDKLAIFRSALEHMHVFALYMQGRGETGTNVPSVSPTNRAPTMSPTKRPTASPLTASPTSSPKGPYFITNPNTGKLITIDGGGCNDGTNLVLWQNDDEDWQKWVLNHDNTIESIHCPGMVVDFEGSNCEDSASIVLSPKSNCLDGQAWTLRKDGVILNADCNTKAIDVRGGLSSTSNGANIHLWSVHGEANQLWELSFVVVSPTSKPTENPSSITIKPTSAATTLTPTSLHVPSSHPTTLAPIMNPTKRPSATPLTMSPTPSPIRPSSEPTTYPTASPTTSITTLSPGTNKPTVHSVDLPSFQPSPTPLPRVPTTQPISTPSGRPTRARQSKQAKKAQQTPTSVFIRNPHTAKLLTINGAVCTPGTDIVLWKNDNSDFQKWRVNSDGSVESVQCPGMVIDIEGSSCSGTLLKLHQKIDNLSSQVWRLQLDGYISSIACNVGKVVDIEYALTSNGAEIIVYEAHGGWNQTWEIIRTL